MLTRTWASLSLLAVTQSALANIDIQFDYSFDSSGFFSDASRQSVLDGVATVFESRFADSLTAIDSAGSNSFSTVFFNPSDPDGFDVTLAGQDIALDVIRIYVGGASLGGSTLGLGGPGGFSCSGFGSFCSDAANRGQLPDPADVSPWGGSISFNTDSNWYFGLTPDYLQSDEFDFYSVALHELAHVLGYGTSGSFDSHIVDGNFVGSAAGTVALTSDTSHWAEGTQSTFNGMAQEAAMDPSITAGTRKYFTDLDFAAMQDIGWQVTPVPEASTWAMMLVGLALVGGVARRRA